MPFVRINRIRSELPAQEKRRLPGEGGAAPGEGCLTERGSIRIRRGLPAQEKRELIGKDTRLSLEKKERKPLSTFFGSGAFPIDSALALSIMAFIT